MQIRCASSGDLDAIHALGLATPELQVSSSGAFMEREELLSAINELNATFLVAEDADRIIGFVYANHRDPERGPRTTIACLVYLVVQPGLRRIGVAQCLYDACLDELKGHGITSIYGWVHGEPGSPIRTFMERNGFRAGHRYTWMDKDI